MSNKARFTVREIAEAVNGKLYENEVEDVEVFTVGVTRNSKETSLNNLFVAIVANRDGHDFIPDAIANGCSAVLISNPDILPLKVPAILVEDTVKAFGLLASYYRERQQFKVVAVTGSVGKTSTREIIVTGLKSQRKVYSTPSNQNNELGLPQTLLDAPENTEIVVLEMGMRLLGEIDYLTHIAKPDIALITNIGCSHIERLGSRENILKAKTEILNGLTKNGLFLINGDDEYLRDFVLSNPKSLENVRVGSITANGNVITDLCFKATDIFITDKGEGTGFDMRILPQGQTLSNVFIPVCGVCHVRNCLYALAVASELGLELEPTGAALADYTVLPGRGKVTVTRKYVIVDDAYNASFESMSVAFENLDIMQRNGEYNKTVLALGCILELGEFAASIHRDVGRKLAEYGFDRIFVTGDNRMDIVKGFELECTKNNRSDLGRIITPVENTELMKQNLKEVLENDDLILFKGSNAFGLQRMAAEFIDEGNS